MIYIGHGMVVEAITDGVVRRPLADALRGPRLGVAYRHSGISESQAAQIVQCATRQQLAKAGYDWLGAANARHGTSTIHSFPPYSSPPLSGWLSYCWSFLRRQ